MRSTSGECGDGFSPGEANDGPNRGLDDQDGSGDLGTVGWDGDGCGHRYLPQSALGDGG